MKTPAIVAIILSLAVPSLAFAAGDTVTRRDGFLLLWHSISRPSEDTREKPFTDVKKGDPGFTDITYAKYRGILDDDVESFQPTAALKPSDALLWLFRTRSVEPIKDNGDRDLAALPEAEDVPALAEHYGLEYDSEGTSITQAQLLDLMRSLDAKLQSEEHEVSLYSEKFNGKGTAFGETFDMYAMTAAHRTFPGNTLVRVTNVANGKSVVVRINDRGPYVQGRDMDLSLGAFTQIADRSVGKIQATFERLGDVNLVGQCKDDRYQRRITKDVVLNPGIPHNFPLGAKLRLSSQSPFVVRDVVYPDGEVFELAPSIVGTYHFIVGTKLGRVRDMTMNVIDCQQNAPQ